MKVSTILDQIEVGSMALPQFQRGFVWNRDQVRSLMHSLYRGFPIGSLLAWVTSSDTATARGDQSLPAGSVKLLLDGQQRMSTLYGVIRGGQPPFFDGDARAFTGLYFHLDDEVFEFYRPTRMDGNPLWVDVTELMRIGSGKAIENLAKNHPELAANLQSYINRLNRIDNIKQVELHIEEVAGEDKTVDTVVEIFNLVNSGGTKLSKGDLALARICAGWPEARDEFRSRLRKWSQASFDFEMDWLLRNINTILTGQAYFSALREVDSPTVADGLHRAEYSVDTLLNLISSRLGLDHNRVLGGRYAFPVMSRYLQRQGGLGNYQQQGKLLYWYVHSFLWGRHAGSTESVINQDLAAIEGMKTVDSTADGEDPLDRLIAALRQSRGDLTVRAGDFAGWSLGARFYPLLYLLTRVGGARDWCNGIPLSKHMLGKFSSLQLHHIFPKAYLYRNGADKTEVNALANFAFLTTECNQSLSDRPPQEYFEEVAQNHPGALESQWIPMDRDLWRVENYRDFLGARRELLGEAANRMLGGLLEGYVPEGAAETDTSAAEELALTGEEAFHGRRTGIAASEEDEQKLSCAYWADENGLPEPDIDFVYADPETGEELAVFDLAWPAGIQQGLTEPVAVLLEEPRQTEEVANKAGYRFFTSVEEFKSYAKQRQLGHDEDNGETDTSRFVWGESDIAIKR